MTTALHTGSCTAPVGTGEGLTVAAGAPEENKAERYLARLQGQKADPSELAVIVFMMYGATLRGDCRTQAKIFGAAR